MAHSIEFQLREENADLRERNAQLETTVRQAVANNGALHECNARLVAALEEAYRHMFDGAAREKVREALANQQSTEKP